MRGSSKYRHEALFQQLVSGSPETNEFGEPNAQVWTTQYTRRAGLFTRGSREFFRAAQDRTEVTAVIHTRYDPDVMTADNGWRIVILGNNYDIEGFYDQDGLNREIVWICKTGVTDGD